MKKKKTFLIMGNYRGGTTAVTAALLGLNVDIKTPTINLLNLEDKPFYSRIHNAGRVDVPSIKKYIEKRNQSADVWGVKYPAMHLTILEYIQHFRNPHLVFVFRDPVAVAHSERDRKITGNIKGIMARTMQFNKNMMGLSKEAYPYHFVSFERLLMRTEQTLIELNDFVGNGGDVDKAKYYIDYYASYEGNKQKIF